MNKKEFLDQFRSQFNGNKNYYSCFLTLKKIRQSTGLDEVSTESEDFIQLCKDRDILITGAIVADSQDESGESGNFDNSNDTADETKGWNGLKELLDMNVEDIFYHPFWQLNDPSVYLNSPQLVFSRMFNMKTTPVLLFTEKTLEKIPEIHPEIKENFKPFFSTLYEEVFAGNEIPKGLCLSCNADGLTTGEMSSCPYCGSERVIIRRREFPLSVKNHEWLKKYSQTLWPEEEDWKIETFEDLKI